MWLGRDIALPSAVLMAYSYYTIEFQAVARTADGMQLSSFELIESQWMPIVVNDVPFAPDDALGWIRGWMERQSREAFAIDAKRGVRIFAAALM